MQSTVKKRGRPRKSVNENKTKRDQNGNKKAKMQEKTVPDNVQKNSPINNDAQLLNEIVQDDKNFTIKLEFEEPMPELTSEIHINEQPFDDIKSEPNSPSSLSEADESNKLEYLDSPYMSRAEMVLNMTPITDKEEEIYAELYESNFMDKANEYDWCNNTGECMYDFYWWRLPDPPKPYEKRYLKFGDVKYKNPSLKEKVGPIKEFTAYEAFTELWNKEVMEVIISETNKNGKHCNESWIETTMDELYVFLAITLAINMDDKKDLNEFWKENNSTKISDLSQAMTNKRFEALNFALSFSNVNADASNMTESQATVSKIKPIISVLNKNLRILYEIGQDVVIDEPLEVCKRNEELFKIKKTSGIKEVNICDAKTGYTTSFLLCTAKKDETLPPRGISPIIILKFMQAYKDKGYSIFCNNIFNSPILVRTAYILNFNFVGTLGITEYIDSKYNHIKKEVGEVSGASCEDMDYILWRWRDENLVSLVSTYHGKTTNEDIGYIAPAAFIDFKKNVASLDNRDKILADYVVGTEDWVRRMFNRLLNISVFNSSILTKCAEHTSDSHRDFRLNLIHELIIRHKDKVQLNLPSKEPIEPPEGPVTPLIEQVSSSTNPLLLPREPVLDHKLVKEEDPLKRLIIPKEYWEHYPEEYGIVPGKKRQRIRKACILCQKSSQTMCPACNVPLCLSSCHRLYHSMLSQ